MKSSSSALSSLTPAKSAPVINSGSPTILGKRSYEQHNGVDGESELEDWPCEEATPGLLELQGWPSKEVRPPERHGTRASPGAPCEPCSTSCLS